MNRGGKTILPVAITCALTAGLTVAAIKTPWSALGGRMLSSLGSVDFGTLLSGRDGEQPVEPESAPEPASVAVAESENAPSADTNPALEAEAPLAPAPEPGPLTPESGTAAPQAPPAPPAELTARGPAAGDSSAIDYAKLNRDIKVVTDTLDRFNQKLMRMIAQAKAEQVKERNAAEDATAVALDKKAGGSK